MAVAFFINRCVMALAIAVGLLIALAAHGWVDFQSLTGVPLGPAAYHVAAVLIWTIPLAAGELATHLWGGNRGDAEEAGDDAEAWLWGGDDATAR